MNRTARYQQLFRVCRTANFRFAALYMALFTVSALLLGGVVFWTTRSALQQSLMDRVDGGLSHLSAEAEGLPLSELVRMVHAREGPHALDYLLQGPDGTHLAGEIPNVGTRRGWLQITLREQSGPKHILALARELPNGAVIAVGDSIDRIHEAEEAVLAAFAWAIGATLLLGAAGGAWLSAVVLRRIDTISSTAERIIAGNLAERIPLLDSGDELDRLAATLNRMLDRIGALLESARHASNNIAHDLRTPLSRLKHRLEEARTHAASVPDYQRAVQEASVEVDMLLGTFAALLRIAEIESGCQRAQFNRVDLSAMADTVVEAFTPPAEDSGHQLAADIAPGIVVYGDKELLTQMLVNLVENAIRHTPPGTRITMRAQHETGTGAELVIQDNGPGIPEAERENVLRRFYRLDQSRTTPGSGLGLSLVAAVVELHGAAMRLEDAAPGLRVRITLPASVASEHTKSDALSDCAEVTPTSPSRAARGPLPLRPWGRRGLE